MFDRLFIALQYLLPKRLLGRIVYRLARSRVIWLKNAMIRGFVRVFPVDVDEMVVSDPCEYESFNAFFTRDLAPGARPIDPDPARICCPADGTVQQVGRILDGQLIQAKGIDYRLDELLDIDSADAGRFDGGAFLTVYLAPHNYHRVHAPTAGRVSRLHYVPGELFSVNATTARYIDGLFALNERVACQCVDGPVDYWLVFVGALNVASVSTAWTGEIEPQRTSRRIVYREKDGPALTKGDYFGHFNMGSTVILVYPPGRVTWDDRLNPGDSLRVGQEVGHL